MELGLALALALALALIVAEAAAACVRHEMLAASSQIRHLY
jgi:hypothetical protein